MKKRNEEIDELLILAYLQGESISEADRDVIETWLNNPQNRDAAREIYQAWELSLLANPEKEDTKAALNELKDRINHKPKKKRYVKWAVAASILVFFSFSYWLITNRSVREPASEQITTTTSDQQVFNLQDGSTVTLNVHSTLSFSAERFDRERSVRFTGEAYFDIIHNADNPFTIKTEDAEITVLGTKFYVATLETGTEVSVVQGKVKVLYKKTDEVYEVNAGQHIAADLGEINAFDPNNSFWNTKTLVFREDSLKSVFETLSKIYSVTIISDNENINNCLLTSRFEDEELEVVLDIIGSIHSLNYKMVEDKVIIYGDGCN